MTTTSTTAPIRNGVDTAQVYGTLDVLKAQPAAARFEFRVRNRWIDGTHSRSTIHGFWGAGGEDTSRAEPFIVDASEPPVLFGHNEAPNPAEYLLHALAGCLTLTIVNVAAARKVELHEVTSTLTGVLDARGATGVDESYRNGFERIDVVVLDPRRRVAREAPGDRRAGQARSVVYDMVTNGVPGRRDRRRGLRPAMELTARTPAGADLVALAEWLADDFATRAADHDRDGTLSAREPPRPARHRLPRRARPGRARRARRELRPRPRRRLGPPGPGRRVGRDRGQHAPRRRDGARAPAAGRRRGRQRAARGGVRRVAGGHRPRAARDRRRA